MQEIQINASAKTESSSDNLKKKRFLLHSLIYTKSNHFFTESA